MLKVRNSIMMLVACGLGFVASAQKQRDSTQQNYNAVYLELGGAALIYSVGYERTWYQSARFAALTSVGVSYIPDLIGFGYIEPGVLLKHKSFALELGTAFCYYIEGSHHGEITQTSNGNRSYSERINLVPRIGIRYSTKNQKWFFRTGFTPIKEIHKNAQYGSLEKIFPWFNVFTVGYRF